MPSIRKPVTWLALAALAVTALAAAVLAAAALVDGGRAAALVERRVTQATGRRAEIGGAVELAWQWPPALRAQDVRLGDASWAGARWMLEAREVTATVRPLALLGDGAPIGTLRLEEVRVRVERAADGRLNWAMPAGGGAAAPAAGATGLPPFARVELRDARVRAVDAASGRVVDAALDSLDLSLDDDAARLSLAGTVAGRPLTLAVDGDGLDRLLGSASWRFGVDARAAGLRLEADGELPRAPSADGITARVRVAMTDRDAVTRLAGTPLPPGDVSVQGRLHGRGGRWWLDRIEADAAGARLEGRAALDARSAPWHVHADLEGDTMNLGPALERAPPAAGGAGLVLSPLDGLVLDLRLALERVVTPRIEVRDLLARVHLADGRLALGPLRLASGAAWLDVSAALDTRARSPLLAVDAVLDGVDGAVLGAAVGQDAPAVATVDGRLSMLLPLERGEPLPVDAAALLERLHVLPSELTATPATRAGTLAITVSTDGPGGVLALGAHGRLGDWPRAQLEARGAPLADLLADAPYPLGLSVDSGATHAEADTHLDALLEPSRFEADVIVSGEDPARLGPWFGVTLPSLPSYRAEGRIARDGAEWRFESLQIRLGRSEAGGRLRLDTSGARPRLELEARSPRLRLADVMPAGAGAGDGGMTAMLRSFDAAADLSIRRFDPSDGITLRDASLDATLSAGELRVAAFEARVAEGRVHGSLQLDASRDPARGRLDLSIEALRAGQLGDTFTPVEEHLGRADGELHLRFTAVDPQRRRDDVALPGVGRMSLERSTLRFVDGSVGTDLELSLESHGLDAHEQQVQVTARGRFRERAVKLDVRGDPLLDLRDDDAPYAIEADLEVAGNRLRATGELDRPLALRGLDLELLAEGDDPSRLFPVLGVPFPSLPPYRVRGDLEHSGSRWRLVDLEGTVGDSDVAGTFVIDGSGARPRVEAELRSQRLDFDDLAGLVGAAPAIGPQETASARQRRRARERARSATVLPDRPLAFERARAVDAKVRLRAGRVMAGALPLDELSIDFAVDDGRMRFDPVVFGIGDGAVRATLDADASGPALDAVIEAQVRAVDLARVLRSLAIADDSAGRVGGRLKLWVRGASTAELLASADGGALLLMTGGELDAMLVELAGLDAGEALITAAGADGPVRIDCALADVHARDGVVALDTVVVDTADTRFDAAGRIDLGAETLDVTLSPRPKDPSLLAARSPLHFGGTFRDPDVSVAAGALVARAASAAALSALATPIAGLLALLETGSGSSSVYCEGLVESLDRARGAR